MEKPTANVRQCSGAACLYMTTEYSNNSSRPKVFVSLYWRAEIPAQPWAAVAKLWVNELKQPPWRVEVDINPYAPTLEKSAILIEGLKTFGHSIVNHKVVSI